MLRLHLLGVDARHPSQLGLEVKMHATTAAILTMCDSLPGGREQLLNDLTPLLADKVFFSPEAIAKRYDVSLATVKVWRSKNLLTPSLKVPGGTARYTLADLHRFEEISGRKEEEEKS